MLARETATLVGWSEQPQTAATLADDTADNRYTTLYLIEIPVRQNLLTGNNVTLPLTFLNWQIVAESGGYEPRIEAFRMFGGFIDFEFSPWQEIQDMEVSQLQILLEPMSGTSALPQLSLWHWQAGTWVEVEQLNWGKTAVADFEHFLDDNNTVRIRLADESGSSIGIDLIHPIYIGDIP